MSNDNLGDRMKMLEHLRTVMLMPDLPILMRLDGRSFHTYTRGFARPYDTRMSNLMADTMVALATEFKVTTAYTQSDEITLCIVPKGYDPEVKHQYEMPFGGRAAKLESLSASFAGGYFNLQALTRIPERAGRVAQFDCRVWQVPSLDEAANVFLWRELDAQKNSVAMLARCHFSDRELHGKGRADMKEMLRAAGQPWEDMPAGFRRGTYWKRGATLSIPDLLEVENRPGVLFQ